MTVRLVGVTETIPPPAVRFSEEGIASATQGANLGAGRAVFATKAGVTLEFRTLVEGAGITLTETAETIEIAGGGGASPWTEAAGIIRQVNLGSQVVMGSAAPPATEQVSVVGSTLLQGTTQLAAPDNTALAVSITEAANRYLEIDTTDGAEEVRWGETGAVRPIHRFTVPDNAATAFQVLDENGDNYLNLTTTDFGEIIALGNDATDPEYFLLGNAITAHVGSNGSGRVDATHFGPGAFDVAHDVNVGTDSPAGDVTIGRTGQSVILSGDSVVSSGPYDLILPSGTTTAYRIRDAATLTELARISTSGTHHVFIGQASAVEPIRFTVNFAAASSASFRILDEATTDPYLICGGNTMELGNPSGGGNPNTITTHLTTNQAAAWGVQDSSGRIYLAASTVTANEAIAFGSSGVNPLFAFHGDGPMLLGASGGDTPYLEIRERTGAPTASADTGQLFVDDTSGVPELAYQDENGDAAQLTAAGLARADVMRAATVAEAAALTAIPAGQWLYITDEVDGPVPAFSDGSDWRRCTDRAVIST